MRVTNFYLLKFLFISAFLISCSEDDVSPPSYDVFISGQVDGQAVYWKNGEINYLAEDSEFSFTATSAIISSESDVYIGGGITEETLFAAYWKNDETIKLSETRSQVYSMTVSGSDVYVAGFEKSTNNLNACLWVNGEKVEFAGLNNNDFSVCTDVVVEGSDVHVLGVESNVNMISAKYWKNGVPIEIISDSAYYTQFSDIAVSGDDVHIVGYISDENGFRTYKYWKNGVEMEIPINISPSFVEVSGSDVYLVGEGAYRYSKNGVVFDMEQSDSTNQYFSTTGLTVANDDIYITASGLDFNNERLGGYLWKNGELQTSLIIEQEGVEFKGVALVEK